ncbi:RNA dependent RNA polymerase-domain-containing protein [Truncatella angustata]|uniref:RNA-dependent RNA polymerase n=1 Tax=Truncatella angustata TaxID=152316 RepID=A0A9P8UGU7_9PEZI|nr:RNA dependent RNA polymerase-domain-containing protein [Truncatella angustata]KAH6651893.1 RNA dependent RNA polymerase-domain-containing protein [Truncatella angustata]KAH8205625.1 hypothetical protein TruAng_000119 [Truncatella angustata]
MDVFLRNLPADINNGMLKKTLSPFVSDLGIGDWACNKQRNKTFGTVQFLHVLDGEKFLRQHGEIQTGLFNHKGLPRTRARLTVMGQLVYCRKSNQEADPFMIKTLEKDVHDRKLHETLPEAAQQLDVVFGAAQLSCGYYDYNQVGQLTFSPEVQWPLEFGLAKFSRDRLIVRFHSDDLHSIRVEMPYRAVDAILTSTNPTSLTLTLWEPPRIFQVENSDLSRAMRGLRIHGPIAPSRSRLVEIPHGNRNHGDIIGQCLVYQIQAYPEEFLSKVKKLRDSDLLTLSPYNFPSRPLANHTFAVGLKTFRNTIQQLVTLVKFEVLFQVQALVQNGYLLPWTAQKLLIRLYKESAKNKPTERNGNVSGTMTHPSISGLAIKKLFSTIPFPAPEIESSTFTVDDIMHCLEEYESEIRLGLSAELISERAKNNLTMIYKIQVTPASVSLHGPEPDTKNRVLRKFEDNSDYFVRVQFCDEDGQDIQFNVKVSNEIVYNRFQSLLDNGTQVGGRKYDFLGFSHSSLRAHSAWLMAPFIHNQSMQTYFNVIDMLGDFNKIHSPARCAARIGQAFSETPFAISLKEHGIDNHDTTDIYSKDGRRNFTDGVGWVSQEVVDAIQAALPQKKEATCFQIRWGGAKGMLALDARKTGNVFAVRPSMVKFSSDAIDNLEICDLASKPIPLVLNRQMIKILEDMAVPNDWFFQEQDKEVNRLRRITATTFNTVAFLKRQKIADQLGLPRLIRRLDQLEIDYKNDRFLRSVVEAVILRELRLLKHKARIPIEQGVTLFGVVDETGFLEEGEVYITFDLTDLIDTDFLSLEEKELIVTRSPALHPGDIQLATNKIPPAGHSLRMLKNCIVFSQKGSRDLPSQLSGGDLDGDIYHVIWDEYAVSKCGRVFAPADYPRVEAREIDRQVEKKDMTEFFIEFMKNDNLSLIATRHMILADQRPAGTFDEDCKKLAQLHSTSVDYSKSGVPVDSDTLRAIKPPRYRPDFLAPAPPTHLKKGTDIIFDAPTRPAADNDDDEEEDSGPRHRYYKSEKILGQLYRAIDESKIWSDNVRISRKKVDESRVWDSLMSHVAEQCEQKLGGVAWTGCLDEARDIRRTYEDAICTACIDYSEDAHRCITELEIFTGNIFNKSGVQTRRQRDRSLKLKDHFDCIATWIEGLIRKRPIAGISDEQNGKYGSTTTDGSKSTSLQLSIASLHVGCIREQGRTNGGWGKKSGGEDNLSFKIVAACCVVKELDIAIKQAEIKGGGHVGTSDGL